MQHLLEDSLVLLGYALGKIREWCTLGVAMPLPRCRTKGTVKQIYSLSPVNTLSHSAAQHILVKIIVVNVDMQKGFVRSVACFFH